MDLVSPKSKFFVNFVNFKVLSILLILILILNCVFICNLVFLNDSQVGENAKKLKESLLEQKQGSARFHSLRESSAKLALRCKTVSQPKRSRCGINMSLRKWSSFAKSFCNSIDFSAKIFVAAKPILAHECYLAAQEPPFPSCEMATKLQSMKIPNFAAKDPFRRVFHSCETTFWHTSAI